MLKELSIGDAMERMSTGEKVHILAEIDVTKSLGLNEVLTRY